MKELSSSNVAAVGPVVSSAGTAPTVPPNLGSIVAAELEAMRNDLQQAQALADDYRWQLAGKSNECAELRHLLEKAQRDLVKLEGDINMLRQDRHRLANQAMKAQEAERYAAENAKLREEREILRRALRALKEEEPTKPSLEADRLSPAVEVIKLDYGI